ncbi:winged-helix domain-containing protein [Natrialba asiatica]|nr:winged-helix domain-containing protein [Natrialba asiatica]
MTGNDDSILEFLGENDVALAPRGLEINLQREGISISKRTIQRRVKKLHEKGLIEKVHENAGYYAITDKGRQYLEGELDASELEDDGDNDGK